jgi:hypothetical protein
MKSRKYGISEWQALSEPLELGPVQSFANIRITTALTVGPKDSAQLVPNSALNSVLSHCLLSDLFPFTLSSHLLFSHPSGRFPAELCIFSILMRSPCCLCVCIFCLPPSNFWMP